MRSSCQDADMDTKVDVDRSEILPISLQTGSGLWATGHISALTSMSMSVIGRLLRHICNVVFCFERRRGRISLE